MSNTQEISTEELQIVEQVIDSILVSSSIQDFCRALVHSDISGDFAQGAQVFALNNVSELDLIASYGVNGTDLAEPLSVWGDGPISVSLREKRMLTYPSKGAQTIVSVPLLKDQVPIGVIALTLQGVAEKSPIEAKVAPILGKIVAFYLETSGAANGKLNHSSKSGGNGDDLTNRQVQIIELMADGLVNAEIAKELMLSESTIRQETVRIYRSLGVGNRAEAAKKARALGLIARRIPSSSSVAI